MCPVAAAVSYADAHWSLTSNFTGWLESAGIGACRVGPGGPPRPGGMRIAYASYFERSGTSMRCTAQTIHGSGEVKRTAHSHLSQECTLEFADTPRSMMRPSGRIPRGSSG